MPAPTTSEPQLFDQYVEDYDASLECGLRFSGESRDYFALRRVAYTGRICSGKIAVRSVMDFGCGPGGATPHLLAAFPTAEVIGTDNSAAMIEVARKRYGSSRTRFVCGNPDPSEHQVDVIYCNGVFHHIPPAERAAVVRLLFDCLRPGGLFALWENNPWNPGTRLVMSRIPFDRDAITLSYRETKRMLRTAGFGVAGTSFHFYFPNMLKVLRPLEVLFRKVPLGGQYCVFATKPS